MFDTCRVAKEYPSDSFGAMYLHGSLHIEDVYEDYKPKDSNLVLIFSSEPTNVTYVNDKCTNALIEYLKKK